MSKEREALQDKVVRLRSELRAREETREDERQRARLENLEQKEAIRELLARQERLERMADALAGIPEVAAKLREHAR
jgi:hypothetical protein